MPVDSTTQKVVNYLTPRKREREVESVKLKGYDGNTGLLDEDH